jgi:hypothetical protein
MLDHLRLNCLHDVGPTQIDFLWFDGRLSCHVATI